MPTEGVKERGRVLELEMEHEGSGDTEELTERAESAEAELEELEAKYKKTLRASDDTARAKVRALALCLGLDGCIRTRPLAVSTN